MAYEQISNKIDAIEMRNIGTFALPIDAQPFWVLQCANRRAHTMMDSTAQVVIIGAGIMGASIAYHLAARGCTDVLILEQAETEISGSTARSAAGVRHQFSTEVNVRLSLYGVERLKHFTQEIGGNAELKQIGYLFLIDDPATWLEYQRSVAMQRRLGARVELLTPEEAARFVPETRVEG